MWEQRYFNHSQVRSLDITKLISNKLLEEISVDPSSTTLVTLGDKNSELTSAFIEQGIPFKNFLNVENVEGGLSHFFEHPTHSLMIVGFFSHSGSSKSNFEFFIDPLRYFDLTLAKEDLATLKNGQQELIEKSNIVDKNKKPTLYSTSKRSLLNLKTDFESQSKFIAKLKKLSSQNVLSQVIANWPLDHLEKYKINRGQWDFSDMPLSAALDDLFQKISVSNVENQYIKCQSIEFRLLLWQKFKSNKNVKFNCIDLIMESSLSSILIKAASEDTTSITICFDEFPKVSFVKMDKK